MGFNICPAAVVAAPVETVWELLDDPVRLDEWWDARTVRIVPEGKASPGQVVYARASAFGLKKDVTLRVERVDPEKHQIQWTLSGFGVINHQTTTCTAIDAFSCFVQYG